MIICKLISLWTTRPGNIRRIREAIAAADRERGIGVAVMVGRCPMTEPDLN